ncbi:MAG: hypothetical protein P3C12_08570 [Gemmatimonadota bacterium]|nr:hypothetical protein [Gemmatimonadota bacterium]
MISRQRGTSRDGNAAGATADVERVRRATASRTTPYTATELQGMP